MKTPVCLALPLALLVACLYDRPRAWDETYPSSSPSTYVDAGPRDARASDAASARRLCEGAAIERFKELLVVDDSVTSDVRAFNEADGAWSFRRQMERLAGATGAPASDFTLAWLASWRAVAPRPAIDSVLICPWLHLRASNACDDACSYCAERVLDLARAPFGLLAIVNRIDRRANGAACGTDAGEGRLVYFALDPKTRAALPFTVIFEYGVQASGESGVADWAARWHALGALPFGEEYAAKLQDLTDSFAIPSALHRVRTNEVALGAASSLPWEMREFALALTPGQPAALAHVPVTGTPPLAMNGTPELAAWIEGHADAIRAGDNALPEASRAPTALVPSASFRWEAPGASPEPRRAFSMNTCSGCHAGERDADPLAFQHLAPGSDGYYGAGGATRISRFLHDPPNRDELSRREDALRAAACAPCPAAQDSGAACDGGYAH
jgi:hypothetical protein